VIARIIAATGFHTLLVYVALNALLQPAASAERPEPVTILLYHRFEEPRYPTTNISREALVGQLKYLRENGYRTIGLDEFKDILDGQKRATGKEVLVTVDDGYRSVYEVAWPLFRKYEVPFIVFVSTESLEKGYSSMMSWSQLEEMHRAGVIFGNHSHAHPHIGFRREGETVEGYRQRVRNDVASAARILKEHGISTSLFAYPYGEYNDVVIQVLGELGYELMFSQNPGVAFTGANRTRLDRMALVGENLSPQAFRDKLSRLPLSADLLEPNEGTHSGSISGVTVRLKEPAAYDPGQINVFLSERGRLAHRYDPEDGRITFPGPIRLERGLNRIIVTAREKERGKFGMMSWLILGPPERVPTD